MGLGDRLFDKILAEGYGPVRPEASRGYSGPVPPRSPIASPWAPVNNFPQPRFGPTAGFDVWPQHAPGALNTSSWADLQQPRPLLLGAPSRATLGAERLGRAAQGAGSGPAIQIPQAGQSRILPRGVVNGPVTPQPAQFRGTGRGYVPDARPPNTAPAPRSMGLGTQVALAFGGVYGSEGPLMALARQLDQHTPPTNGGGGYADSLARGYEGLHQYWDPLLEGAGQLFGGPTVYNGFQDFWDTWRGGLTPKSTAAPAVSEAPRGMSDENAAAFSAYLEPFARSAQAAQDAQELEAVRGILGRHFGSQAETDAAIYQQGRQGLGSPQSPAPGVSWPEILAGSGQRSPRVTEAGLGGFSDWLATLGQGGGQPAGVGAGPGGAAQAPGGASTDGWPEGVSEDFKARAADADRFAEYADRQGILGSLGAHWARGWRNYKTGAAAARDSAAGVLFGQDSVNEARIAQARASRALAGKDRAAGPSLGAEDYIATYQQGRLGLGGPQAPAPEYAPAGAAAPGDASAPVYGAREAIDMMRRADPATREQMARYVQRHGLMVDGKLMPGSEVAKTPGFINAARGFDREGMLAQARRQGQDPRQRAALAPENLAYSSVMREMEEDARYDAPSLGPGLGMYNQRGAGGTPYREVGSVQAADAALMGDGSVRTRAAPGLRPGLSRPDSAPRGPGALARPAGKVDDDREAQKRISRLPKDQQPKAWNDYQDLKLRKEQAAAEAQSRKDALAESKAAREQANENARLDRAQRTTLGVREFQSKDYATESQERVGMEQARATAQRYQQSLAASSARLAQSASYKAAAQRYKGEASAYAAKIQRVLPAADWSGEKIPDYTPVLTLIAARGYGPAFLKQLDAIQAQNAPAATREALILDLLTKAGV